MKKKVALSCSVCKSKNYFENKTGPNRITKNKYCKNCNTSILHKEEK